MRGRSIRADAGNQKGSCWLTSPQPASSRETCSPTCSRIPSSEALMQVIDKINQGRAGKSLLCGPRTGLQTIDDEEGALEPSLYHLQRRRRRIQRWDTPFPMAVSCSARASLRRQLDTQPDKQPPHQPVEPDSHSSRQAHLATRISG